MGKNIKKTLSYFLGLVLALGLGISYAYAVGANDSNAFVTKQEWLEKVEQLETSIENVNKTVNDTTMDFMISGPRLRVNMVDGFENTGGQSTWGNPGGVAYYYSTYASTTNRYWNYNSTVLMDQWDGSQGVTNYSWPSSDQSYNQYPCLLRFALRTDNEPNTYIVVSMFYFNAETSSDGGYVYMGVFDRVTIGQGPQDYSQAGTYTVTLNLNEWGTLTTVNPPATQAKTSSAIYTARPSEGYCTPQYMYFSNNNAVSVFSNPGTGFLTRAVTPTQVVFTFDFPATTSTMKQFNTSSPFCVFNVLPINMTGRKFGNMYDQLALTSTGNTNPVVKVYSPQKGSLALKSYINGEIPIFNE